jgi:pimeloyl-ACP methyl ester carboxylesterase
MTVQEAAEMSLPFNYAPGTPRDRIEEDWAVRFPLAASPTGYLNQLAGASAWSGLERLPSLDVPTLVLHGDVDRLVPADNGRMLAGAIRGAELTIVPDANHLLMTDQPEQVEKVLLGWLDQRR